METFSGIALVAIAIFGFLNARDGNLGDWLKAKFFNASSPPPKPRKKATSSGGGGGGWVKPLTGDVRVSQPFGNGHPGVDLTYPGIAGAPIRAIRDGAVIASGVAGGCGLSVTIEHDGGYRSRYCHASRLTANAVIGNRVNAGDTIAAVGSTGESTGPHLHLELYHDGALVDPCGFIACGAPEVTV